MAVNEGLEFILLEMLQKQNEELEADKESEKSEGYNIPDEELEIIEEFLDNFQFLSETSSKEELDLTVILKALPKKL